MRAFWISIATVLGLSVTAPCQQPSMDWRLLARKYAQESNWNEAFTIVETQLSRDAGNPEVLAWHARLLLWSGRLEDSEAEWNKVLAVAPRDPDNWLGIASVYSRRGNFPRALEALDRAVQIDPSRADIHVARARALLAVEDRASARLEFRKAAELDSSNAEARRGMASLRGAPKHVLLLGTETDLFSFSGNYQQNGITLLSQWSQHWKTSFGGGFFERSGLSATKLETSVTGISRTLGGLTLGATTAHDRGIIPRNEAFIAYDRAWKLPGTPTVRAIELVYGQHWYWYSTARILTVTETTVLYLPRDWMWSLSLTGARTQFSGPAYQWSPSGASRLSFPVVESETHGLRGNVFFACGTENFAQVDQIGSSSSRTYGGGVRQQLTASQDVTGFAAYQMRSQNQSQISFGVSYGLRF